MIVNRTYEHQNLLSL